MWATVSFVFLLIVWRFPPLDAKNIINMCSVSTIWCGPRVESSFVVLEEGVCYDQCMLLAKLCYLFLCFILYCKAKFACYSRFLISSYFLKILFIYFHWRIIALQHCSGFCHILTWISHGYTCVPHPEHPSQLPSHPIPQGHPSAPAPSCFMHRTWTGNLFHIW